MSSAAKTSLGRRWPTGPRALWQVNLFFTSGSINPRESMSVFAILVFIELPLPHKNMH